MVALKTAHVMASLGSDKLAHHDKLSSNGEEYVPLHRYSQRHQQRLCISRALKTKATRCGPESSTVVPPIWLSTSTDSIIILSQVAVLGLQADDGRRPMIELMTRASSRCLHSYRTHTVI